MNVDLAQELLNQLGSSLEKLETQQTALFQLLKDRGVVAEDELAPYLDQAGKASGVRWRATHLRLEALISAQASKEEAAAEKEKRPASGESVPGQGQQQEAKTTSDEAKASDVSSGKAPQQQESPGTKPEAEKASAQSASERDKK